MKRNVKLSATDFNNKNKKNIIIPFLTLGFTGLLITACGPTRKHSLQQFRSHGPTDEKDIGLLVNGVSGQQLDQLLDDHPNAQARIINKSRGIYELYSISTKELKTEWPHIQINQNQFFKPTELSRSHTQPELVQLFLQSSEMKSQGFQMDPTQFQACQNDPDKPDAQVQLISVTHLLKEQTIELGGEITLSSAKSSAHPQHQSPLRIGWMIQTPTGATKEQEVFFTPQLTYKPEAYGYYQVLLMVQDQRNVCNGVVVDFQVTGNKPYAGNNQDVDPILKKIDRNIFTHLPELQADEAQQLSENKGKGVIIAVIDTGVNYNHPALLKNIWINNKEIPNNKIDDDLNGWVDDNVGYDFINGDEFPFDDHGHGSHVSGIAASSYFGVAPEAQIMALKALSPAGGDVGSTVGALYYALENGAQIINLSLGSYDDAHPLMVDAMKALEEKGIIVVAASGNGDPLTGIGVNTDIKPNFPSALPNSNIIAVAAKDSTDKLAPYSNYGVQSVDVVAPGGNPPSDNIMSSFLDNPAQLLIYGMAGTSMATPNVSGVIALMISSNPKIKTQDIKHILLNSGPKIPDLDKYVTSGRNVNALEAVQQAKQVVSF